MKNTQAIEALGALAHEHRLKVYRLLVQRGPPGLSAGAIADGVGLVPSSLTFHLQALHRSGLITQRRESRQLFYSADFKAMNALMSYLTENCCAGSGEACADAACGAACEPSAAPKTAKRSRAA
jgi:ArsR family transcriptional regulator, arsenate/arsenite/antimonite-responsive transcriptional repressor